MQYSYLGIYVPLCNGFITLCQQHIKKKMLKDVIRKTTLLHTFLLFGLRLLNFNTCLQLKWDLLRF